MRILLLGTVEFSLRALEKLIDLNVNLIGVCTKDASDFNSDFADLKPLCISNKIPYILESDINSPNSVEWIENMHPDVIFCFGWSKLLGDKVLNLASIGVVGYHPAALPANRGRHPLSYQ